LRPRLVVVVVSLCQSVTVRSRTRQTTPPAWPPRRGRYVRACVPNTARMHLARDFRSGQTVPAVPAGRRPEAPSRADPGV